MHTTRLASTIGALTAALISVAAWGSGQQAASDPTTAAPTTTATSAAMRDDVTKTGDVFGAGCAALPEGTEGSPDGMVDDPVATAASNNNPLLKTLVTAVEEAGLVDILNKADADCTVFAPYDPAFEALGEDTLNAVLADKAKLTAILTYRVVPQRMDKDGVLASASLPTVQDGTLKVEGSGDNVTANGAKVLCGKIPTANATVLVIDKVMTPAS